MNIFGLCYGVYQKTICTGTGLITFYLTFLHTSFEKIFCQNLVKKNCKFVAGVFSHNACIGHEKDSGSARRTGYYGLPVAEISIYYCEKIVGCFRLPRSFIAEISDLCYDNIMLLLRQSIFFTVLMQSLCLLNMNLLLYSYIFIAVLTWIYCLIYTDLSLCKY